MVVRRTTQKELQPLLISWVFGGFVTETTFGHCVRNADAIASNNSSSSSSNVLCTVRHMNTTRIFGHCKRDEVHLWWLLCHLNAHCTRNECPNEDIHTNNASSRRWLVWFALNFWFLFRCDETLCLFDDLLFVWLSSSMIFRFFFVFGGVLLLDFPSTTRFQCHFERWASQFWCRNAVIVAKMKRFHSELFRMNQFKFSSLSFLWAPFELHARSDKRPRCLGGQTVN